MIGTKLFKRLCQDDKGVTLVEFAFVGPVLIILLMGLFDMAHAQYTSAQIAGAMQKAGRDLTLESAGSQQTSIDNVVIGRVKTVVPGSATITLEKLSHFDFTDIGEAENFTDDNDDGICNDGEPFEDANENGQWDANRGQSGIGGARDAVLYTAVVEYPRLFPIAGLVGMDRIQKLEASTVLRNQPYGQQSRETLVGNCP
ncbi:MAG: TadE family protein [Pseudomonadota bacterium]